MLSRPRPAEPWRPAAGAKKVPKRYKGLGGVDPAYWDDITVWKSSGYFVGWDPVRSDRKRLKIDEKTDSRVTWTYWPASLPPDETTSIGTMTVPPLRLLLEPLAMHVDKEDYRGSAGTHQTFPDWLSSEDEVIRPFPWPHPALPPTTSLYSWFKETVDGGMGPFMHEGWCRDAASEDREWSAGEWSSDSSVSKEESEYWLAEWDWDSDVD